MLFPLVPRRVIGTNRTSRIFLHGYSDASERAIGACIYIRTIDDAGNNSSHLLCAKSKVAPIGIKRTTLPRLELCAAVILARLINNVTSAINQPFFEIRAWVDSSVVLVWLNGGASRWKTFVSNRVAEITTHLPAVNWSHIASEQNPADLISRGASPEQIQHNSLWWNGPAWSPIGEQCESTDIPTLTNTDQQHIDREQRAGAVAVSLITLYENDFLDGMMARYYPDLTRLLRVTARILRLRSLDSRSIPRLLPRELDRAQTVYIRHVQQQHFREELERLRQQGEVSSHSSLHQLKPFLDEEALSMLNLSLLLTFSSVVHSPPFPKSTCWSGKLARCHAGSSFSVSRKNFALDGRQNTCDLCSGWQSGNVHPTTFRSATSFY
ncbi:uncharacterized protein LOC135712644 [Ochlerotatus camptorhynchus]|uniref:uncharacterized protein LOC135712644 n=1 Tax=Ochlerotatus camptorhynchus TaxID=644619 RepID=UPI0031DD152C